MDGTGPTARGAGRGGRSGKRESAASPVAVSRASATIREVKRPVEVLTGTPEELVADAAVMRRRTGDLVRRREAARQALGSGR